MFSVMNKDSRKTVVTNRKAWHEYTIEETYEAGIVLVGVEVKSIRAGNVNLSDSFCRIENGELWVQSMYIAPYEFANRWVSDTRRPRKLLMHRAEIERIRSKYDQRGYAIIPLKIYFERGYAKMEIGIGRGKKLYDKRETLAQRDIERNLRQEMSGRE